MVEIITEQLGNELSQKMPIFATEDFLAAKGSQYGWFISKEFALPFVVDDRLRRIGYYRLLLTNDSIPLCTNTTIEEEKTFLNEVLRICEQQKAVRADYITTQANAVFRTVPVGSESLAWGSYIVDLTKPEAAIVDMYHPKHRHKIRRAARGGVSVTTTGDTDVIYGNLKDTMVRQGLLFFPSKKYLRELQRRLDERVTFYIAVHDAKIQGSAVVIHNGHGAFYYYGGSIEDPFPGSLTLMQYEIMRDLKMKNVPVYDLMGARIAGTEDCKIHGIQHFKQRFASGMRSGYRFRQIICPVRHRLATRAIRAYFFLKGSRYSGDVIDQMRQSAGSEARDVGLAKE